MTMNNTPLTIVRDPEARRKTGARKETGVPQLFPSQWNFPIARWLPSTGTSLWVQEKL